MEVNEAEVTVAGNETAIQARSFNLPLILKNFLALSTVSVVERIINLFTGVYARRVLGVLAIGEVGWTASMVSYFSLLVNPGFQVIAKREVARDPGQAGHYAMLLALLQAVLAALAFGLAVFFSSVMPRSSEVRLLLILQAAGLFLLPLDLTWLLQARERLTMLAAANTLLNVLQALFLVLIVRERTHVVRYVLLAYPFRLALYGLILHYVLKHRLLAWYPLRSALVGAWSLMCAGFPIGLSQAAVLIYYNSDAIFLGFTHGDAAVGLYSTAYSLMLVPTLLSSALLNAYFPALSRVMHDDQAAKRISGEFLKVMIWLSFPIAALGWAMGRHFIVLLFGQEYAPVGSLFEWLSLNLALIFFNTAYGWPLNAWGAQKLSFICTLVGALVNLATNFVLIPRFGPWGAVVTTLLSELAVMVVTVWIRRSLHPVNWFRPLLTGIAVCLPAAILGRWVSMQAYWFLALPLCLAVCGGGMLLFEGRDVLRVYRHAIEATRTR